MKTLSAAGGTGNLTGGLAAALTAIVLWVVVFYGVVRPVNAVLTEQADAGTLTAQTLGEERPVNLASRLPTWRLATEPFAGGSSTSP